MAPKCCSLFLRVRFQVLLKRSLHDVFYFPNPRNTINSRLESGSARNRTPASGSQLLIPFEFCRGRCDHCRQIYRLRIFHVFDLVLGRLLSLRSLYHSIECVIVTFAVFAVGFLIFRTSPTEMDVSGPHKWTVIFIYSMFACTVLLVIITVRRVILRWKKANSDVHLEIV